MSRSVVSRRFVALIAERLRQWLAARMEVALPVVMIDGIHLTERVVLVALGFDAQGGKHVLGIREGSTEKTQVVRALLADLIERGLDPDAPRLLVIDGVKALRRAITETFGDSAWCNAARSTSGATSSITCPRNCTPVWGRALRDAWNTKDAVLAERPRISNQSQSRRWRQEKVCTHCPGAASSSAPRPSRD
jgi:putative transposase